MHAPTIQLTIMFLAGLLTAGCAGHGEIHVAPDESKPHVTWEIRSGPKEGDEDFVCGSAHAEKPCVLNASTDGRRTLAAVYLLAHAAAQPTNYLGFIRASFFEGESERKLGEFNVTVEPGTRPVGATVVGLVTSKPGSYALTISIDATQEAPRLISQEVPIVVSSSD
jgi:hypothetical protein